MLLHGVLSVRSTGTQFDENENSDREREREREGRERVKIWHLGFSFPLI